MHTRTMGRVEKERFKGVRIERKDKRGDYVLDDTTRGELLRMIKAELEKEIHSRIEWIELPISDHIALGYMIGLLEEKTRNILSRPSPYRFTKEQQEKCVQEAKEMIKDLIPKILEKIGTERHK